MILVRQIELIFKKIELVFHHSASFKQGMFHYQTINQNESQEFWLKFFKTDQIQFILFSKDVIHELLSDQTSEQESSLIFFSLHLSLYNIFNQMIQSQCS